LKPGFGEIHRRGLTEAPPARHVNPFADILYVLIQGMGMTATCPNNSRGNLDGVLYFAWQGFRKTHILDYQESRIRGQSARRGHAGDDRLAAKQQVTANEPSSTLMGPRGSLVLDKRFQSGQAMLEARFWGIITQQSSGHTAWSVADLSIPIIIVIVITTGRIFTVAAVVFIVTVLSSFEPHVVFLDGAHFNKDIFNDSRGIFLRISLNAEIRADLAELDIAEFGSRLSPELESSARRRFLYCSRNSSSSSSSSSWSSSRSLSSRRFSWAFCTASRRASWIMGIEVGTGQVMYVVERLQAEDGNRLLQPQCGC
ncbi:hypothetical protein KCU88_g213, partial [Aureobasidium melanogenum]